MQGKVAYLLSRFPKISETFILREINALQEKGMEIELFPLILETQSVVHNEAKPWLEKLHHYPWLSADILWTNLRVFLQAPIRYVDTWGKMFFGNLSNPQFLVRAVLIFPKAVRMSVEMRKNNVRHVHAHFATHPALAAWIIHRIAGISYSVTVHAHDIYVSQTMLKTKMNSASFIIAISEFNRRFLNQHVGTQINEKIRVVHCGIDAAVYSGNASGLKEDGYFEIKSIGSLEPYKGARYLIEACALLVERNIPLRCEIIGQGILQSSLQELIRQYKLDEVVFLAGAKTQTQVANALAEADCYVQPSIITETGKMEGIPVAIMEALGSGLPVIASDISGISELVRAGETGYLVKEKNALDLANALEHVYKNMNEAQAFAKNGQELVVSDYDININAAQVAALFEQFIDA